MTSFSQHHHEAEQTGDRSQYCCQQLAAVCDPSQRLSGLPLSLFQQASTHLCAGEYAAARQLFDYLIQQDETYWAIWYQRGVVLHELDEFELAIASYQTAQTLQPPLEVLPDIWYQQADVWHYGLGDPHQAIAAYDQAIALNPNHSLAWLDRGNAQLYGLQEPEAALTSYSHAVTLTPNDGWLWYNRANALAKLGFYYAAIHNYDRALHLHHDPTRIQAARQRVVAALEAQSESATPPLSLEEWQRLALLPTERDSATSPSVPQSRPLPGRQQAAPPVEFDTLIQQRDLGTSEAQAPESPAVTTVPPQQSVLVIQDSQGLRQFPLVGEQLTVGRAADCDIRLFSKFASRCHAVIRREPADPGSTYRWQYRLRDGNLQGEASTNGLMINGEKQSECLLQSGDIVYFGPKVWFRYFITGV